MTRPPAAAEWLVRVCCPARDREFVLAELEAEFVVRGSAAGWYWRQAAQSAPALLGMGARREEWECGLLAVLLAAAGPALLTEAWWSFLLRQVPLRAGEWRGADFAMFSLAMTALLSFGAGMICSVRSLIWALPAAWIFTLLGLAAAHNSTPWWLGPATLAMGSLGLAAGAWLRKTSDGGRVV
jgi:hypothetical protein